MKTLSAVILILFMSIQAQADGLCREQAINAIKAINNISFPKESFISATVDYMRPTSNQETSYYVNIQTNTNMRSIQKTEHLYEIKMYMPENLEDSSLCWISSIIKL